MHGAAGAGVEGSAGVDGVVRGDAGLEFLAHGGEARGGAAEAEGAEFAGGGGDAVGFVGGLLGLGASEDGDGAGGRRGPAAGAGQGCGEGVGHLGGVGWLIDFWRGLWKWLVE